MSAISRLQRPPAWLSRHPYMHAWWLETANRTLHSHPHTWPRRIVLLSGATLGTVGLSFLFVVWWGPSILALVGRHLLTAGTLMALQSSVLVHRSRQRWTRCYSENWLSTVPISRRAQTSMIALRSFCWPFAILAATTILAILTGRLMQGSSSGLTSSVLLACVAGTLAGVPTGWWLRQREPEIPRPGSVLARGASRTAAALSGISRWPLIQTKVWLQPRSIARFMLVAVALPADTSANIAVAIMWVLIVGAYLAVLLRATVHVAREGSTWLRPTPLSFGRFAWAVVRYSIVKQLQWSGIAAITLIAMGADPVTTLRIAELWLATFSVASSIALAHSYHSRGLTLKMLVSLSLLALIETLRHHLALPCALLFSGWQLRKAARS
jgi:hypothetical protein